MVGRWFLMHYVEVLGALAGLLYLYFSYNKIIWLWLFGIVTSLLYIFVFWEERLFADMSLQVYYVGISIYGWIYWVRDKSSQKEKEKDRIETIKVSRNGLIQLIGITALLTVASGLFLDRVVHSSLPYWDAFTTSASIVATFMLARKMIENWLFWVVIDATSMAIYIYKGLFPTAALFAVYFVIAILGYLHWKKEWKQLNEL